MQDWFSLVLTVFVKSLAHWLATGLPLVLAAPLLGLLMNMERHVDGRGDADAFGRNAGDLLHRRGGRGGGGGAAARRALVSILVLPLASRS
jgi:heme exporter protein B